jgi:NAD(P)-dependent dehydrogenase (short-subunit alcohol dehydrogenase family)
LVEACLASGGEVFGAARRRTRLDELTALFRQHDRLHTVECDASDSDAIERLVADLSKARPLDAIIHAVGSFHYGLLADLSETQIRDLVDQNLLAAIWVLRAGLRCMIPNRRGAIVLLASDRALDPAAGFSVYGATKAAAAHLVEAGALEGRPYGVRANGILPGIVRTDDNLRIMPRADSSGWASPKAVARAAVWLAGPDAEGITGTLVRVPGA